VVGAILPFFASSHLRPSPRSSRGLIVIAGVVITESVVSAASRTVPVSRCVERGRVLGSCGRLKTAKESSEQWRDWALREPNLDFIAPKVY